MRPIIKCPSPAELTRMYYEGEREEIRPHLESCEKCRSEWREIELFDQMGSELDFTAPDKNRLDQVRIGVFVGVDERNGRSNFRNEKRIRYASAAAIAVLILAGLVLSLVSGVWDGDEPAQLVYRATVISTGDADYIIKSAQPDEVIELLNGKIQVEVSPLMPAERFRVIVGDSVVEVRGTVFDVSAEKNELIDVFVHEGKVEVIKPASTPVVLQTDDKWSEKHSVLQVAVIENKIPANNKITQTAKPEKKNNALKTLKSNHTPSISKRPTPEVEKPLKPITKKFLPPTKDILQAEFEKGWLALKEGRYHSAASAFDRACNSGIKSPLNEDAAYWRAVAYRYAGKTGSAEKSLRRFLSQYGFSPRAGEASVMLGWILLEKGRPAESRAFFESAANDPVAKVRESARAGLQRIRSR